VRQIIVLVEVHARRQRCKQLNLAFDGLLVMLDTLVLYSAPETVYCDSVTLISACIIIIIIINFSESYDLLRWERARLPSWYQRNIGATGRLFLLLVDRSGHLSWPRRLVTEVVWQ